jgi:vacuolar-type H+-ATPase subunit H
MPSLRDILLRLRRSVAPPGAALPRMAPPADTRSALSLELGPIFDAVDVMESASTERLDEARRRAEQIVEAAKREAKSVLMDADRGLPAIRAQASGERRVRLAEEIADIEAAARTEASRIREVSRDHITDLVECVVACVRSGVF